MSTPSPRRLPSLAAAALLAVAALSACAGNDPEGPRGTSGPAPGAAGAVKADDPNAPVEITVYTGQTQDWAKILNDKADEFGKLHPNVKVRMIQGAASADLLLQKLTAAFQGGTHPNAAYTFGSWATELEQSGHTLDITANVKEPSADWAGFPKALRDTATPNGRVIGFPAVVDSLSLFYNKKLFDEAKLPYPTPKTTWAEFREMAKKLTNPAKSISGTAASVATDESGTWQMWPRLWQEGGEILTPDKKKSAFNSEAGIRAVELWRQMAQEDKSVYLDPADKAAQLFASGNIGMLIAGPWIAHDLVAAKTPYEVTDLPNTNGNNESVAGIDNWALFDKKNNNQNYWTYKFFEWLTNKDNDPAVSIGGDHMPLRASGATSEIYKKKAAEIPGFAVMAANISNNIKHERPIVNGYVGLSSAYAEAVSKILQGQSPTKPALDDAAKKADAALAGQ